MVSISIDGRDFIGGKVCRRALLLANLMAKPSSCNFSGCSPLITWLGSASKHAVCGTCLRDVVETAHVSWLAWATRVERFCLEVLLVMNFLIIFICWRIVDLTLLFVKRCLLQARAKKSNILKRIIQQASYLEPNLNLKITTPPLTQLFPP